MGQIILDERREKNKEARKTRGRRTEGERQCKKWDIAEKDV